MILWNKGQVTYYYIWTFFPLMNSTDFFGWYHSKNYKLGRNVCSLPKGSWTLFRMLKKTSGGMLADRAVSTHLQDCPSRIVQQLQVQMPWIFLYSDISLLVAQSSSNQLLLEAWTCCLFRKKLKVKGQHKIVRIMVRHRN